MTAILIALKDPKWSFKFPPPDWFYLAYDAILMNVAFFKADDIRKVPLHLRYRYRAVCEQMKKANHELAHKAKAVGVYDYGKHY